MKKKYQKSTQVRRRRFDKNKDDKHRKIICFSGSTQVSETVEEKKWAKVPREQGRIGSLEKVAGLL